MGKGPRQQVKQPRRQWACSGADVGLGEALAEDAQFAGVPGPELVHEMLVHELQG